MRILSIIFTILGGIGLFCLMVAAYIVGLGLLLGFTEALFLIGAMLL